MESPDRLVLTLANALNLPLQGGLEPEAQLLKHLQNRELLLILDSFEHLLVTSRRNEKGSSPAEKTGGVALLLDILQQAPAVKMMITSRQRLNLNGEWTLPVEGLPLPESATRSDLVQSGAVRLLLERGSRVRPNFDLATADGEAVARLCRLTGGMPLAIELAAGWLKMLTCAEIAAEVAWDLNFLSTTRQDVPDRQRNIRVVFEYSWRTLGEKERWAARHLSVFRGGFRREAAEAVLGRQKEETVHQLTSRQVQFLEPAQVLNVLATLVDHSILSVDSTGRYRQHPLVRQFAADRLGTRPGEQAQARARHGQYFATFIQQRKADVEGLRKLEALAEIDDEIENIRAAWPWLVLHLGLPEVAICFFTLLLYFSGRNQFDEASWFYEQAVKMLQQIMARPPIHPVTESDSAITPTENNEIEAKLGYALACQAASLLFLGHLEQAQSLAKRSLIFSRPAQQTRAIVMALDHLGMVALVQGREAVATRYIQEAAILAQATDDCWLQAMTFGYLGHSVRRQDYMQAAQYFQQSAVFFQELGDNISMLTSLFLQAEMHRLSGNIGEAKIILNKSLAIARESDCDMMIAWHLVGLGELALTLENYGKAQSYLREGLAVAARDDTALSTVPDLSSIEDLSQVLRTCPTAKAYFDEALDLALNMQNGTRVLEPLIRLAHALAEQDAAQQR